MILVNLKGRLGNQMFQYAVASIIAQKNKTRVLLDANLLNIQLEAVSLSLVNLNLNVFSNNYNIAREEDLTQFKKLNCINKIKRKFGFNYPNIYKEASFNFNPDVLLLKAPTYLEGYFQSYKYYFNHESFIKNLFTFRPNHLDNINKETALKIEASNSISIHIRRGDQQAGLKIQFCFFLQTILIGRCNILDHYLMIKYL
ncbi:MAG: alpha-1,2-fucosyltransferase [Bacteroidetes bacterium]|nr:alpha-1,2-fucosyltransferase [Bacteroidota bacterium]